MLILSRPVGGGFTTRRLCWRSILFFYGIVLAAFACGCATDITHAVFVGEVVDNIVIDDWLALSESESFTSSGFCRLPILSCRDML